MGKIADKAYYTLDYFPPAEGAVRLLVMLIEAVEELTAAVRGKEGSCDSD